MKPIEQDEMFPEASSSSGWDDEVGNEGLVPKVVLEGTVAEKGVHTDFYNTFDDLFDDDDLA